MNENDAAAASATPATPNPAPRSAIESGLEQVARELLRDRRSEKVSQCVSNMFDVLFGHAKNTTPFITCRKRKRRPWGPPQFDLACYPGPTHPLN